MHSKKIIEQVRAGNERAMESLYKMCRPKFAIWVMKSYGCSHETAMNAYQGAILAFYENIMSGKLKHLECSPETYLFAIGKNKVQGQMREERKWSFDFLNVAEQEAFMEGEDQVNKEKVMAQIEQCLEHLSTAYREVLYCYYYQNLSMTEIAKLLGYKNADTAKNMKYKAICQLRRLFERRAKQRHEVISGDHCY